MITSSSTNSTYQTTEEKNETRVTDTKKLIYSYKVTADNKDFQKHNIHITRP